MEFFRHITGRLPSGRLADLAIADLPRCCASIDRVLADAGHRGTIYCLWGEFEVERQPIRGGLRFSLPKCPNALAWTITDEGESPAGITLHCTINRATHDPDFVASIDQFMDDWVRGLAAMAEPPPLP